jgi:gliding motility-associated-like protein
MKNNKLFRLLVITILLTSNLFSQNLLTNGDFESGGAGNGFTVPDYYLYTPSPGNNTGAGSYIISNDPTPLNATFIPSITDHSPGDGNNMMVVDGHPNSNTSFWSAGNNASGLCVFTPNKKYQFSYWIRTISTTTIDNATLPRIQPNLTGASDLTLIYGYPTAELPDKGWKQVVYTFIARATCVKINLIDINTNQQGNDFALDDLELAELLCDPTVLSIQNPAPACLPTTVDITAAAVTAGSIGVVPGGITYWKNAAADIPLTSPPATAINVSGTYYIKSQTGPTCFDIKPVIVTVKASTVPTFTQVPPICAGAVLSALPTVSTNGIPGTWALTTDNITTKEYTFTPDSQTNPYPNLVVNGDFSAGNTGFTSEYIYRTSSDGVDHGVYGINTNAKTWFTSFEACVDHTTGTGNFMIADGSTVIGGNVRLWRQNVAVTPGEDYIFSFFAESTNSGGQGPAVFKVTINGVSIGTSTLPQSTCNWIQISFPWNSGINTTADISIYDTNDATYGNDFGIDDISLKSTLIQCAEKVKMTITVTTTPAPTAADQSFCTAATVANLVATGTALQWYNVATGGTALTSDTSLVAGDYYVSQTLNTCESLRTKVMVTINTTPAPAAANQSRCNGATIADLVAVGTNLQWYDVPTGGKALTSDTTLITGDYYVSQTLNTCESVRTMITVTVGSNIAPTFGSVADICVGETLAPLPTTSLNGITGSWSPALDNTRTDTYTFMPNNGQCASIVTLLITVNEPKDPDFVDFSVCPNDTATVLEPTSPNGITGLWTPSTIDTTTNAVYVFTPDDGQCANPQRINITIKPTNLISIKCNSGDDFSGDRTIVVEATAPGDYLYQLDYGDPQTSNVFENVKPGSHDVTVSDPNGCGDPINETVIILDYPKYFTPNADGVHDQWNIAGLENQVDSKIFIFDRQGKLIKQISPQGDGWNGFYNGEPLPATDYWFVLDYFQGPNKKQFKSHFALKR